jgi:hypothetical protein
VRCRFISLKLCERFPSQRLTACSGAPLKSEDFGKLMSLAVDLYPSSLLHSPCGESCEKFTGHLLLRKEVIQPQVPLRLPCYDFIPVTAHSLGHCLLAVGACTSGTSDSHDVTGGVYKARERIHGAVADAPLLAIPASRRRVAACDPNWAQF